MMVPSVVITWLLLLVQRVTTVYSLAASSGPGVEVFDNVLNTNSQQMLHQVASDAGPSSHQLIDRSTGSLQPKSSPLERALDSILTQLNDTSPYIEYWCRQEWRHIEAHADVDEFRAKTLREEPFRYPTHGHVVYLMIGSDVRGPTCIFEDCQSGGDLISSEISSVNLLTVPAVDGRLLRFPGNLLHTVPRPTDLWLLPFVQGSPDLASPQFQRSVVLFNTWNDDAPLHVPEREEEKEEWCQNDENDFKLVHSRSEWNEVEIASSPDDKEGDGPLKKTKIWLLGDLARRDHALRTVPLYSDEERLRQALQHATQPHRTTLLQTDKK